MTDQLICGSINLAHYGFLLIQLWAHMPCWTTWFQNLYTNIVCGFDGIIDPFCAVVNDFLKKVGLKYYLPCCIMG